MAKTTKRAVKPWTKSDEQLMAKLVKAGTPTAKIARTLKRSAASIRSKAQKAALSLKPAPKAPAKKSKASARA